MALVTFNFESQYLGNNHTVGIILPDKPRGQTPAEFYGNGKKYKVLWLLHGTFGDYSDWIRKSMIELYACEKDLIVVMPSALNSNYSNWPGFATGYMMFDYLFDELMPCVYNWFPASDKREDNFIAGLSMGGGGALKYAVNRPEKFAAAAILSAPAMCMDDLESIPATSFNSAKNPRTKNSIANAGSLEAYVNSYENTWKILDEKIKTGTLPKLYFCCGDKDFLWKDYNVFKEHATKEGFDILFEEAEGYAHEWRFWDIFIQKALTFFGLDQMDAGNPF